MYGKTVKIVICGLGTCTSLSMSLISTAERDVIHTDTLYGVQSTNAITRYI